METKLQSSQSQSQSQSQLFRIQSIHVTQGSSLITYLVSSNSDL